LKEKETPQKSAEMGRSRRMWSCWRNSYHHLHTPNMYIHKVCYSVN